MNSKILVADDAPFIREVLRHILLKNNFELVGEACDGQEAIILATQYAPKVILMDIVMPRLNGIEATKVILERLPRTKVIACSTEGQESMVLRALEVGCCDFIAKPFQIDNLIKTIKSALGDNVFSGEEAV